MWCKMSAWFGKPHYYSTSASPVNIPLCPDIYSWSMKHRYSRWALVATWAIYITTKSPLKGSIITKSMPCHCWNRFWNAFHCQIFMGYYHCLLLNGLPFVLFWECVKYMNVVSLNLSRSNIIVTWELTKCFMWQ